jgi:hypothetical protein
MALSANIRKYNKLFLTVEILGPHSGVAEDSNVLGMLHCIMVPVAPHFLEGTIILLQLTTVLQKR